jgi:membrane protein implicated in regulation of membrane protease activity
LTKIYLAAVAFGVTLLLASLLLGGKDTDADGDGDGDGHGGELPIAWAPVTSLRFWVFFLAFGGGAGLALEGLGSSAVVAGLGALGIGWAAGALAISVVNHLRKHSVSSELGGNELIGTTGTLLLPASPDKPGKVRVEIKGRAEDYVASVVEGGAELPAGTPVLIVAEGERGSLLVEKGEM